MARKLLEVNDDVWKRMKLYCIEKNIKIGDFVMDAITAALNDAQHE